ncbi:unnamed protein product [Caenorhabditis sp. 36 PRJEB53466]|nr:unnamed protein product [Caenorhabditis sp. 36 PRJEB53466]
MNADRLLLQLFTSLFAICIPYVFATNCFHCISPDKQYNATVRRQLATQTDVFFYPIGVKSHYCSDYIDQDDPHIIEGQICSKYSKCVTLFPNLPGSTFVVRGCLESILRHTFREDERLHEEGCFLLRSLPMFPKTITMDYVVCTCHGPYCNNMAMPATVERPYHFGRSAVLKLALTDDGGALRIATSSGAMRLATWLTIVVFFATPTPMMMMMIMMMWMTFNEWVRLGQEDDVID